MKVISGSLKGRNIIGYSIVGTRPTMDRVKESIFGMIQDKVYDSIFLDLFSGSGNIGIEAISNGSKLVYFNDKNYECIKTIKSNLENFNVLDKSILLKQDYLECLNYLQKEKVKLDIVFLDPPYKDMIMERIIDILIKKDLLNNDAYIICEATYEVNTNNSNITLIKNRVYGEKKVFIYKFCK